MLYPYDAPLSGIACFCGALDQHLLRVNDESSGKPQTSTCGVYDCSSLQQRIIELVPRLFTRLMDGLVGTSRRVEDLLGEYHYALDTCLGIESNNEVGKGRGWGMERDHVISTEKKDNP